MRVKLRVDKFGPHPDWKACKTGAERERYARSGKPLQRHFPAGAVMDAEEFGEDVWQLCLPSYANGAPEADPEDDEARQRVAEEMAGPYRDRLEDLQDRIKYARLNPDALDVEALEHLRNLGERYGVYSGELDEAIEDAAGIVRVEIEDEDEED